MGVIIDFVVVAILGCWLFYSGWISYEVCKREGQEKKFWIPAVITIIAVCSTPIEIGGLLYYIYN